MQMCHYEMAIAFERNILKYERGTNKRKRLVWDSRNHKHPAPFNSISDKFCSNCKRPYVRQRCETGYQGGAEERKRETNEPEMAHRKWRRVI